MIPALSDLLAGSFFWRALLAGAGIALLAGPLGSFVVWRRMAYFGDSLAHAALLGIALSFLFQISISLGIVIAALGIALLLACLRTTHRLAADTLLGIFAHSTLALGLVIISLFPSKRVDLMSFLFGDILSVSLGDLGWIFGGGVLILGALALIWQRLLLLTIHEELAIAEAVKPFPILLVFMVIFALFIALAMKIVGILLVTSLLLLPAAAARPLSTTPERMALFAALFGLLAVLGGLTASFFYDLPSGPAIVVAALIFLLVIYGLIWLGSRIRRTS